MQCEGAQHKPMDVDEDCWVAVDWTEEDETTTTTSLVRTASLLRTPDLATPEFTTPRYGAIPFEEGEEAPAARHVSGQVREERGTPHVSDEELEKPLTLNVLEIEEVPVAIFTHCACCFVCAHSR